jgi:hypothetical protein
VLWVAVRGNWLSVQVLSKDRKSRGIPQCTFSTNDPRLHFGLAGHSVMDKVEIRWPNGGVETLRSIPADAIYAIVEGQGVKSTVKLLPPTPY